MTDTKSIKVLKKEEVEKGNHGTVVELPFVEIVDEEAESTKQDVTVKLPNDTKVTITKIAHSANKESFLVQSIVVKNHVVKDLGLYAEAEVHEKEMEKCQIEIHESKIVCYFMLQNKCRMHVRIFARMHWHE